MTSVDPAPEFDFWPIVFIIALVAGVGWLVTKDNGEETCGQYDYKYDRNGELYCDP